MTNSYEDPKDVNWGWFDQEIMQGKFKGWIARLPRDGSLPSEVKKIPGVKFTYYRIKENGDIYADGTSALIFERGTPNRVQVIRYSPPEKGPRPSAAV
jgi:hypothetical protein